MEFNEPNWNRVPVATHDGLYTFESVREQIMSACPDSDRASMPEHELEGIINEIFTHEVRSQMAQEIGHVRHRLEQELDRVSMEVMLPVLLDPDAEVMYSVMIEGRNTEEMLNKSPISNGRAGYYKEQRPLAVQTASEWSEDFRERRTLILFDDRLYESKETHLPRDADHILSCVHKFEVVERKSTKGSIRLNRQEYVPDDSASSVHWRIKSGPEIAWKMVDYLSGSREDIVDTAGARIITGNGGFGEVVLDLHRALTEDHRYPDLVGSVILQALTYCGRGQEEISREFLESLPNRKSFVKGIMKTENREFDIRHNEKVLPYYVELLTRVGTDRGDTFHNNVIDTLVYPSEMYKAMNQSEGHDRLSYMLKREKERSVNNGPLEMMLAHVLAETILRKGDREYMRTAISSA